MSYDLDVLVLDQETPIKIEFDSLIDVKNEIDDSEIARYHTIWPYMTHAKGIWYSLSKKGKDFLNVICGSDYDIEMEDISMPYWISDDEVKYNLTPLLILEECKKDFTEILKYLTEQSPVKTIMFLSRYQGGEHEIICGILSINEFLNLLEQKKILFNVCYIIRSNSERFGEER